MALRQPADPDRETTASKRKRATDSLDELARVLHLALARTDHLADDGDERGT